MQVNQTNILTRRCYIDPLVPLNHISYHKLMQPNINLSRRAFKKWRRFFLFFFLIFIFSKQRRKIGDTARNLTTRVFTIIEPENNTLSIQMQPFHNYSNLTANSKKIYKWKVEYRGQNIHTIKNQTKQPNQQLPQVCQVQS